MDLACEEADRLPCLQMLLALGANVNAHDKNGESMQWVCVCVYHKLQYLSLPYVCGVTDQELPCVCVSYQVNSFAPCYSFGYSAVMCVCVSSQVKQLCFTPWPAVMDSP